LVSHGLQLRELGDVVLGHVGTGEDCVLSREYNVCKKPFGQRGNTADFKKKLTLTGNIRLAMSISTADMTIWVARSAHAPRSFADNLWRVAIRVTENSVKHLVAADVSDHCQIKVSSTL
jgi:hypothetical protein